MGLSPDAIYNAAYTDLLPHLPTLNGKADMMGCTYKQFSAKYLLDSIIRKWVPENSRDADLASLSTFISANNRCKEWNFIASQEVDSLLFNEVKRILDDFLHPSGECLVQSIYDLLRVARPGPGVNVGSLGTSYYTKYMASPLTTTSVYLYEEYRNYADWIPTFSDAERQRYEDFGSPRVVSGSKCSFVPKTNSTSRMVCVEPSLNMFYQLGLATLLERRLDEYFGINLAVQPTRNHRLAQIGSIDGSFATIDLSSASDSISLRLCESLLPKWFFELLLLLRSHTTEIDGKRVPLFMISTMGNGFTFPLQTIIFSAIVLAVRRVYSSSKQHRVDVFGDDIICESNIAKQLVRFLGLLGFAVNAGKTFLEGPFRESCGADWFHGQPVRPVFIRRLDAFHKITVAINQLNEWSAYTGISLTNVVSLLINSQARKFLNFVPFAANNDSGIRVPFTFLDRPRYDRNLSYVFRTWEKRPSMMTILEQGIRSPNWFRKEVKFNPSGLYCSFLFGELVENRIMVRHNLKSYSRREQCSPFWDYIPSGTSVNGALVSWRRWETAVWLNCHESWKKFQHES